MQFVVAGLLYFDEQENEIVRPHFTCEARVVDCTQYNTREDIERKYSRGLLSAVDNGKIVFITLNGTKYFESGFSPCTTGFKLLSEVPELMFRDENTVFNT